MCHNFGSLSCRSLTGEGVTQVIVSQEYYKCRHRTNCFSSIHPVEFYLIWVFHVVMLWSLIFFSSLFLGNCWFWSHDRWQNSQATIKCDTHHSPISPNTKHGMECPSSNLFDMWIFVSRYVGTWILDILMHFFHQDRPEEIHISLLVLESLMLMTYILYMMTNNIMLRFQPYYVY